jgi:hypothetical protein
VGFGPQLVDLDGDGQLDLISGSWPGEIFFFRGKGSGQFEAPIKLKDKNGKAINIGGGIREDSSDTLLIAGDATVEKSGEGIFVLI